MSLVSSSPGGFGCFRERHRYFLDVLGARGEQALPSNLDQAAEAGIAVPVKLLGIGEGALHRFLAPLVDRLAPRRLSMNIRAFACILPDMPGDGSYRAGIGRAGGKKRAVTADGGV